MDQTADREAPLRRRRKRKSRSKPTGMIGFVRGRALARGVFAIMAAGAVIYTGLTVRRLDHAASAYGPFAMGMSEDEVRYRLGEPAARTDAGQVWIYERDAARTTLRFSADGKLAEAACGEVVEGIGACPAILGLHVGSTEYDVRRRLGSPDADVHRGPAKLFRYSGLGVSFRLNQHRVVAISHSGQGSVVDRIRVVLWQLVP